MRPDRFTLAATTNDLTQEPAVRDVADIVEFRMDKASDPLAQLDAYDGGLPVLATNRAEWAGGHSGDSGRLDRLFEAADHAAVELVDVELETAREREAIAADLADAGVEVVVSFHDFDETPDDDALIDIFEECAEYGDIAKVAAAADDYGDTLRMLEAVYSATERGMRVAGISMGGVGSHTRVVAPLYGSELGYAPLADDETDYAPGQLPIRDLAALIETLSAAEAGSLDARAVADRSDAAMTPPDRGE